MTQGPGTNKGTIVMGTDDKINGFCLLFPYAETDGEKSPYKKQLWYTQTKEGGQIPTACVGFGPLLRDRVRTNLHTARTIAKYE
jgi:hypothetical protein